VASDSQNMPNVFIRQFGNMFNDNLTDYKFTAKSKGKIIYQVSRHLDNSQAITTWVCVYFSSLTACQARFLGVERQLLLTLFLLLSDRAS